MKKNDIETDVLNQKIDDNFTPAQKDVIKHQSGNLLVSASAGSGKTRVLIEKIVRLIMSGATSLKNLLVVTFTNSASLELKQRLSTSLIESGNAKMIAELDNLSTSDILTFDAFCIKILREFGYTIGYNDNFAVADDTLSNFLKNQALDNIFAKHNKEYDARFVNFISQFFENRNENKVRTSIVRLYNFLKGKAGDSYESKLDQFYELNNDNLVINYANNYIKKLRNHFENELKNLKLESQILGDEKLASQIDESINLVSSIEGDLLKEFLYLGQKVNLLTISKNNKNDSAEILEIKNKYVNIKESIKKDLSAMFSKEILELGFEKMKSDLVQTKKSLKYLFEIIDEFDKEYSKIKKSYRVLDFNDIEKLTLAILQDQKIASAIQDRYTWIFIDEYQDTSALQENIVAKITTGDNLFMVGDLKQSIYRFRQAEPQIFLHKYNSYKEMISTNCLIELKTNFRSENSILQFNNFVFDKIYKKDIDDFEYKNNSDLEYGGVIKKSTQNPQVNLLIIDDEDEEDDTSKNDLQECQKFEGVYSVKNSVLSFGKSKSVEKQAILLTKKIQDIIGSPYYDAQGNLKRVCFKDIAVLSRTKVGVIPQIRKILKEANIPVTAEYSENIFDCYDMKILMGILSAIDNQNDDIPLLTALVNIGSVSFDELTKIKQAYSEKKYFYEACYSYLTEQNDDISQKVKDCLNKLEFYRNKSNQMDILELVDLIIENEKWETYFASNGYLEEFESHMQTFAFNVQTIKNYSLSEFVNYVNSFLINIEQNCVINGGEDSITLTTIHKSKGLEYPVVFLIGTEKNFSSSSTNEKILMDNDWGISMSSFDAESHTSYENIIRKIFKQKIADEEKKEQKRLLYVALTRAKNYLIVIGSKKSKNLKPLNSNYDIAKSNNFLDWIVGTLSDEDINLLKNKRSIIHKLSQNEKFSVELIASNDFNHNLKPIYDKSLPKNFVLDKKRFFDILSQKFPHSQLAKKNTVTQIMQEEEHYNISDFKYTKTDSSGEVDFSKIGTAYHKFMQLINFCDNKEKIAEQIKNLVINNKIAQEEFELIEEDKIINAVLGINSIIGNGDIVSKEKQFLSYFSANKISKSEEYSKLLIQGVADLIIEKENEIYLVDYKTSRLNNEIDFVEKYKTQLDLYAKSIEEFYNKKVTKKLIYSFHLNKLIII